MMEVCQPDAGAISRIDGQQRMEEHAHVAPVAYRPQAAHAPGMGLVVQFGRVLDRQHVPPRSSLPGARAGVGYQFARRHFVIRQPAPELNFPRPVSRQLPQADGLSGHHALEQNSAVFLNGHPRNEIANII